MHMFRTIAENLDFFKKYVFFNKNNILPERIIGTSVSMKPFDCAGNISVEYLLRTHLALEQCGILVLRALSNG